MLRADDRAVSVQIGAILVFGLLVLSLSTYQAVVVPSENRGVEYEHSRNVQADVGEFRNAIADVGASDRPKSAAVRLGTGYPTRALFVNPPPASGDLRTAGTDDPDVNVTVANATAEGEAGDYWDGSARSFETGAVVYRPNYNVYDEAPRTVVEHAVVHDVHDNGRTLPASDQPLIDGDRVSLILLDGDLAESGSDATAVDVRPLSVSAREVAVRGDGGNVTLTLPTRLSEAAWRDLLADQAADAGGRVVELRYADAEETPDSFGRVRIEFDGDGTYRLRLAKVGVGRTDRGGEPTYAVDAAGNGTHVRTDERRRVVVEVRDRYDNPVAGVPVSVQDEPDEGTLRPISGTTDGEGRAAFWYEPDDTVDNSTDRFAIGYGPDEPERADFELSVSGAGGGTGRYDVGWNVTAIENNDGVRCSDTTGDGEADSCTVDKADAGNKIEVVVETEPATEQVFVDFASNDTAVAEFDSSPEGRTGSDGRLTRKLDVGETGEATVYASAVEGSGALTIRVVD